MRTVIAKTATIALIGLALTTATAGTANAATGSSTSSDKCSVVVKRSGHAKMSCKTVAVKPTTQAGSRSAMQAPVINSDTSDTSEVTTLENIAVTRPGTVILTPEQANRFDALVASGVNLRDAFAQVLAQ